ncbi:protein trichome birefringence-like [Chenopodium quinoa]|nr:protein trichome birefringence-like [Chenopodium quinoa]
MAESTKYQLVPNNNNITTDFKGYFSLFKTRKTSAFVYGVVFVFIAFTVFLAFSPSSTNTSSSTWFFNYFTLNSTSPPNFTDQSPRSDFPSNFSTEINSSRSQNFDSFQSPFSNFTDNLTDTQVPPDKVQNFNPNYTDIIPQNTTNLPQISPEISPILPKQDEKINPSNNTDYPEKQTNQSSVILPQISPKISPVSEKQRNQSTSVVVSPPQIPPITPNSSIETITNSTSAKGSGEEVKDFPTSLPKKEDNNSNSSNHNENGVVSGEVHEQGNEKKSLVASLIGCDLYDGGWVRDESYPLYKPGSCKLIDEQFNCFLNGRPDNDYQKLKWKPKGCTLPRLDGRKMLKLLRGKRLVFVGDSLNRNMWESLVCILKNSAKNPKNVYEASGRHYFRNEASYTFVFKDYNCTVEFFVAPFLVQEWEFKDKNGTTKETLRLDLVVNDSKHFKSADIVIFNTGHWWTHEKTSKGEDYYQEGSNVYKQLDVQEAFRKAITTWGRWVDNNVDPQKTHVFFRGYSSTHFRGGQWNSGGQCDSETEPITNDNYLEKYPWKMKVFETVMRGMKTPISYLNITKLTDYRKDAHPSVYRKQRLSTEEKKTPLKFQDCSHWCLPGVPDSWNELLFAEMVRRQYQEQQKNRT